MQYNLFFQPIDSLLRIKKSVFDAFKRIGIENLRDLLFYQPYSYTIIQINPRFDDLVNDSIVQCDVLIRDIILKKPYSKGPSKIMVSTKNSGDFTLIFFNKIPLFIFNELKINNWFTISGKVQFFQKERQIIHPEWIFNKNILHPVRPIYHLTYKLNNIQLYNYVLSSIDLMEDYIKKMDFFENCDKEISDYLSDLLHDIKLLHLIDVKPDKEFIERELNNAKYRLEQKELISYKLALLRIKNKIKLNSNVIFTPNKLLQKKVLEMLNFQLTTDQARVIEEIEHDQMQYFQMNRLLQGDVGSGKTLVALMTAINVASAKAQVAFMAPTDLLSQQHYQFFTKALKNSDIKTVILTGKTPLKERKNILKRLKDGEFDILIGTHTLLHDKIEFKNLSYVIIDEQHRFGVMQRLALIQKASCPNLLIMTATPIPRSLSLTLFGDMDISILKFKPGDRHPITTTIIPCTRKDELISLINKKLELKEQVYWVCSTIEDDEQGNTSSKVYANVKNRWHELNFHYQGEVGLLHGKMKQTEKEEIMNKFKIGIIKILVTTTVIEIGIDVPNASLMIIENAENFGLAQLHQLRGRVGRSDIKSHCVLLCGDKYINVTSAKRLKVMRESNDGFYIAEQDFLLRGSGDIIGTKQSGDSTFFFINCSKLEYLIDTSCNISNYLIDSKFITLQICFFAKGSLSTIYSG